jgi:hypothetical protein
VSKTPHLLLQAAKHHQASEASARLDGEVKNKIRKAMEKAFR